MKLGRLLSLAAAASFVPALPASAESIRLDRLKRADMVALQRGHSVANAACAEAIIKQIDAYGGLESMREFKVDVEASPIVISSKHAGVKHVCEDGVHTMIDQSGSMVLQKFDENGEPTMMEP